MKKLAIVLFLSLLLGQALSAETNYDPSFYNQCLATQYYYRIKFSQTYHEPPVRFREFLLNVAIHNKQLFYEVTTSVTEPKNGTKEDSVSGPVSVEQVSDYKKEFYDQLLNNYQDIVQLEPYSSKNYYRFFLQQFPEISSRYGILTIPIRQYYFGENNQLCEEIELFFYTIGKITPQNMVIWGDQLPADIVEIEDNFMVNGAYLNSGPWPMTAFGFYQNIIVFKEARLDFDCPTYTSIQEFDSIKNESGQSGIWEMFWETPADDLLGIVNCAFARFALKVHNQRVSGLEKYQEIIAHEAGHLWDSQYNQVLINKLFTEKSCPRIDFEKNSINQVIHEEINGFLSQIRHAENKEGCLHDLFESYLPLEDSKQDEGHARALRIISENFIDFIIEDCRSWWPQYGFKIDFSRPNFRGQALMQFADFLDRPAVLEKFAERLLRAHINSGYSNVYAYESSEYKIIDPVLVRQNKINRIVAYSITGLVVLLITILVIYSRKLIKPNRTKNKKKKSKK